MPDQTTILETLRRLQRLGVSIEAMAGASGVAIHTMRLALAGQLPQRRHARSNIEAFVLKNSDVASRVDLRFV